MVSRVDNVSALRKMRGEVAALCARATLRPFGVAVCVRVRVRAFGGP